MGVNLFQFFNPKDKRIFPLFENACVNLVSMSKVLAVYVVTNSSDKKTELHNEITALEKRGEIICQEIFHVLKSSLITPFNREDLYALISSIRSIADCVHSSTKRIHIYKVAEITPAILKLTELIQKSAEELKLAIIELRDIKNITKIKEITVRINSLENQADDIFNTALGKLLSEEKNMIEVIKMKDVLTSLETTTDMFEDAASVINGILVKNS